MARAVVYSSQKVENPSTWRRENKCGGNERYQLPLHNPAKPRWFMVMCWLRAQSDLPLDLDPSAGDHTHTHKTLQQSSSSSLHRNIFTSCELWVSWNLGWQALSFYLCLKWQWSHTGTKTNQSGSSLFQTRTWHHPIFTEISQIHVSQGSMMVYNGLRGQAHLAVVSINIWANHICDSLV